MDFNLKQSIEILNSTPRVLKALLGGIDENWIKHNEGENTWSPYNVVGHLINGEYTDWIPRMEIILSNNAAKRFTPFDRFAHLKENREKSILVLLEEFSAIRIKNLTILKSKKITEGDLFRTGMHPAFGEVTLKQLLAAWVVHDLGHIAQISRVMAKQYKTEVGPWTQYLSVLTK